VTPNSLVGRSRPETATSGRAPQTGSPLEPYGFLTHTHTRTHVAHSSNQVGQSVTGVSLESLCRGCRTWRELKPAANSCLVAKNLSPPTDSTASPRVATCGCGGQSDWRCDKEAATDEDDGCGAGAGTQSAEPAIGAQRGTAGAVLVSVARYIATLARKPNSSWRRWASAGAQFWRAACQRRPVCDMVVQATTHCWPLPRRDDLGARLLFGSSLAKSNPTRAPCK
jgi:hypothetical protein